jgi:hypothetical protein
MLNGGFDEGLGFEAEIGSGIQKLSVEQGGNMLRKIQGGTVTPK